MKHIIELGGAKRSGKDHTANILYDELTQRGYKVKKLAFATPLKELVCEIFKIDFDTLEKFKNEPNKYRICVEESYTGNTQYLTDFRQVLNDVGTPILKSRFGENIWVELAFKEIMESDYDYYIITDFRFPIEYDYFYDYRWEVFEEICDELGNYNEKYVPYSLTTIKINREGLPKSDLESENALNDWSFDFYIDNNTEGKDNIKKQLGIILEQII